MTQKNKLNIMEISCRSDIGGGPEQLFKIISNLRSVFNFYCACPDQEPYYNKITNEGVPIFKLPHRRFEIKSFLRLLKWTKINNIMIVHSHGRGAGVYARLLKLFNKRLKVVHNFHGIHLEKKGLALVVARLLGRLTNKFVLVSESELQIAVSYGLANSSKSILIENGIQIEDGKCIDNEESPVPDIFRESIPSGSFVIGMLSRFDIIKNIPYAIRSLSSYIKSHNNVFLVIGGDGEARSEIEHTISEYNLQNKVILLGFVKNIKRFFSLIDVYLNTSLGEAFGFSTVEAMNYGVPVVASNVYGNSDVIEDNNTGLLFPLDKPVSLVERINVLKDDKKTYDCITKNASESVENRFNLDRMLNEINELYTSLTPFLSVSEGVRIGINVSKASEVHTGVGRYTFNLRNSILKMNSKYDCHFYGPGNTGNDIKVDESKTQSGKPVATTQNNVLRILWEQIMLPISSRKDRIDLFHYTDHALSLFQSPQQVIITVHDIAYIRFPDLLNKSRQIYKKYILRESIKRASIIVADSYSTKRDIVEFFGINEEKIKVVHLGVESRFRPIGNVKEYRLKNKLPSKMILNVGTLEPRKNVITLMKAFKKLREKGFEAYKLVIAGEKGWLYTQIFKEVEHSGLKNEILFLGVVKDEDLPALYNCADIFVYPSLYEGFGLPPLEAMACGIPVVTSNTSSLPEVIGDAGIMVDPDDVNSLCETMCNLLTDKELRCQMSKNGLKRAKLFSWEKAANEILEIYDDALSVYKSQ
ncbi:MAG: glycosyltransferase [Candidatus Scalindua sp.]|nr:glycosyltransferase [Candidatus Scalindua sp.]